MSTAATPSTPLPVRTPSARAKGRHRRPERPELPEGAPTLLLAIPAPASPEARQLAEEIATLIRLEHPGIEVSPAYLTAGEEDGPYTMRGLSDVLTAAVEAQTPPVVVPLSPGPCAELDALLAPFEGVQRTDTLGPHPLLAEAVHVRLSEAGLARADRARLFAINTSADGIVLAGTGGAEALELAEVTAVLLAARLAVPVVAASLDSAETVAAAVTHLRDSGCVQPALAPYLLGPEVSPEALKAVAEAIDCAAAEPIGAYAAVARLALGLYLGTLGIDAENL
ncbi:sirohydrochlorin chelatase [Streptacidiphilus jiangxiensis]|uniref:Sirohydrochlorin ferrochelatase n=1 Tax=Streptacidiphilus jiangxiensis TaxID=235985 RepID=A0A1H7X0W4_STRJI|nr:hypothetical protein [Streptacidiphilus jiangxiensis]SEM27512.1 hypothetical protein SAMN05414137_12266 [Streptacidiphilus jiangxiensis]